MEQEIKVNYPEMVGNLVIQIEAMKQYIAELQKVIQQLKSQLENKPSE